jgi:AmmeMemoRadiSam system protein B
MRVPAVRPPAVAGLFYPAEPQELSRCLGEMLRQAQPRAAGRPAPKAIIAPHAGYVYSGPIAASAYALLAQAAARIARVVLLGPAHRVALRGLALPGAHAFATPLGTVELDEDGVAALERLPQVRVSAQAHALEHSLEVHLPFLQTVLPSFRVVPLVVGSASAEEVAEAIERLWGGEETAIVVSSDLSHYLSYDDARAVDRETARAILALATAISHEQACGATPVAGLALSARRRGMRAELLDLRNSGDTAGDRSRVVGYGAFAFYEPAQAAH